MTIEHDKSSAGTRAVQDGADLPSVESDSKFARLIERHEIDIRTVIISQIPNWSDAEDVYQETCVRLLEKQELWRRNGGSERDFRAWAVTVAFYQVLTHRKKRVREKNRFSERAMELIQQEQAEASLDSDVRLERLIECIGKLEPEGQQLLKLAYSGGLRLRDVAVELGRTEASTYKLHARIRTALRACVERSLRARR